MEPDTVSQRLMQAGDVEVNPGPVSCGECQKDFSSRIKPVKCDQCNELFHKSTCTGETRWKMEHIIHEGKGWSCKRCKTGVARLPPRNNTQHIPADTIPAKCGASKCGIQIKKDTDFLICQECKAHFHKQRKCSEMTRRQIENLDRQAWICQGCEGKEANPHPTPTADSNTVFKTRKSTPTKLQIMQWNCDAFLSKAVEFKSFLIENKVDIFVIQETKLIPADKVPTIKGYTVKRKDRTQPKGKEKNRGGGLLVGVKDTIPFKLVNIEIRPANDKISEWMSIEIPTKGNQKIRITNIYVPPIRTGEYGAQRDDVFNTDKWPNKRCDLILGDVNAHSPLWSNELENGQSDARGEIIENWMAANDMACINDGSTTRTNRATGTESTPDTAFAHSSLLDKLSWKVINELGSDHKPVIVTYEDDVPEVNNKPRFKWKLSEAKWEDYRREIEESIPTNYRKTKANKLEKRFRKLVLAAARKHVGKKKVTDKAKCWMTADIKEAIKRRNELRKTVANNREEWINSCREVAAMITEKKRENWQNYVEELDATTNSKDVWRTIRSMDGRRPPDNKNEVLEVNGTAYVTDKDKAEQFAKTYKGFAKLPVRREDRRVRRRVRKRLRATKVSTQEESEQDITIEELERVITEASANKAAGDDEMPYEFLKQLGPKAKHMLLTIFNRCWAGEEVPNKWRTAVIKPLLKEGKNPQHTVSFRPISLTSCAGKLLEKIIADRMTYVLEERGILNDNQAGFRRNRCTTDQVLKLVQQATDQIHNRNTSNRTIATFFDYAKAFDKVWRTGLLFKMQELGLPVRYIRYVRNFLSGRKTRVEVNGTRSREFRLDEGLPQGSSISPILFIIFINDIDVDLDIDTAASLFADDTATWMQDGRIRGSNRVLMQGEIDKILKWAADWKMMINTDKTKSMIVSSSRSDQNWDPAFTANGDNIEAVQQYRFLGVTVDSDLRFTKHVSNTLTKCRKRVNILKCMSTKEWGNSMETQRKLYLQYVRSVLDYASSSWSTWISDTNMQRLQRVQNQALRSITCVAKTCPVDFLHLEARVEPLQLRYQKNDDIIWDRYARLPEQDARYRLLSANVPARLKTRAGWRNSTGPRMGRYRIKRMMNSAPSAPWRKLTNLRIDRVRLERRKEEYSTEELRELALAKINNLTTDIRIYTDGSTDADQRNGGAGVHITNRDGIVIHESSHPAGEYCSSYTGECVAALRALEWIGDNPADCTIVTDSMSLVEALKRNDWKDSDEWLKLVKHAIFRLNTLVGVLWIPSHCDVPGNERADELAKRGSTLDQSEVSVGRAIIKAKIRSTKWDITHPRAREIYQDKRSPRVEIESKWPRDVRIAFARLRTEHSKDLAYYRYKIETEDDPMCPECGEEEETLAHVLCRCAALEATRRQHLEEEVTVDMMVSKPELCRRILSQRFQSLRIAMPRQAHQA